VDGSGLARASSRVQQWSEQPCVRPVSAVHVTAGHNALRGSGPGRLHAFDHAVARVGCPDRQIDRLCITCCLPFPTVHITPDARRDLFTPPVRRVPYSARPWSSSPRPFARSCWRARWQRPWLADASAMPRANDFASSSTFRAKPGVNPMQGGTLPMHLSPRCGA
jgi:hypothetical protein